MDLQEAKNIVENAEIVNAGTPHEFAKGCESKRYKEALLVLADAYKDTPCPDELKRTEILEHKGFKAKVYYNYVPPYGIGINPANHWFIVLIENKQYQWCSAFGESIKTLEDAVSIGFKMFKCVNV